MDHMNDITEQGRTIHGFLFTKINWYPKESLK